VDAIRCEQLSKTRRGRSIVDEVELVVPAGSAFALLGPNGAGKTTLMKMILGLTRPTSGQIVVLGERVPVSPSTLACIGALIEEPFFYPWMTARRNLDVVLHEGARAGSSSAIESVLEQVELTETGGQRVKTFSQGMRQRLGLATALLRSPSLLVLDEPANGLDPIGITALRRMLLQLREGGTTILVSSHQLHEIEQTCDRIAIMRDGRVVLEGTPSEVRGYSSLEERFLATVAKAAGSGPTAR
jgi:ABC-2 type transport system ATP-binding protein